MRGWDELREEYGNIYTTICKSSAKRKMYSYSEVKAVVREKFISVNVHI